MLFTLLRMKKSGQCTFMCVEDWVSSGCHILVFVAYSSVRYLFNNDLYSSVKHIPQSHGSVNRVWVNHKPPIGGWVNHKPPGYVYRCALQLGVGRYRKQTWTSTGLDQPCRSPALYQVSMNLAMTQQNTFTLSYYFRFLFMNGLNARLREN